MERRNLLKGIAAASIAAPAALLSSRVNAAEDEGKVVDYLFVQNASSVTLKDGVLTLIDVAPHTLYFSDRPDRIDGRITTAQLVCGSVVEGIGQFQEGPAQCGADGSRTAETTGHRRDPQRPENTGE